MCSTTRYAETLPLRRITARTIIPPLVRLYTQFGLLHAVQSDQGSNCTSKLFKQIMAILGIKQYLTSAYYLKVKALWKGSSRLLLFAVRSTKQESLSYSPNELLFSRNIRGPVKFLYESWMERCNVKLCEGVKCE